jgi:GNAT superfamily N-acetyltransferase
MIKEVEFHAEPSSNDIDFLTQRINVEKKEFGAAYPFAFLMRNEQGVIVAGCNGSVIFGVIYTDQLWVHPDYRKTGLGSKLMGQVHEYALKKGCTMATVATMSFQGAQKFYEKLGYIVDFTREGYAYGSSILYMKKEIF